LQLVADLQAKEAAPAVATSTWSMPIVAPADGTVGERALTENLISPVADQVMSLARN
jgi:hypothetical protein